MIFVITVMERAKWEKAMQIEYQDMIDLIMCYEEITILDDLELEYQIDKYS